MLNVLSAICFLVFVVTGLTAAFSRHFATVWGSRHTTNVFIVLAIVFSFTAGLRQRDMWPFSSWTMMVGLTPPATRTLPTLRVVGVDAYGNEFDIDYRAWNPLSPEELYSWIDRYFFKMNAVSQNRVATYFLQTANRGRERALNHHSPSSSGGWMGHFTAPTHVLHPAIWSRVESVPRDPFVGLRMYQESWDLEGSGSAPTKNMRVLAYEYWPR